MPLALPELPLDNHNFLFRWKKTIYSTAHAVGVTWRATTGKGEQYVPVHRLGMVVCIDDNIRLPVHSQYQPTPINRGLWGAILPWMSEQYHQSIQPMTYIDSLASSLLSFSLPEALTFTSPCS